MLTNRVLCGANNIGLDLTDITFDRICFDQKNKEFFVLGSGVSSESQRAAIPFDDREGFVSCFSSDFVHIKSASLNILDFEEISDIVVIDGQVFVSGSAEAVIGVDTPITTVAIAKLNRDLELVKRSVCHDILTEGWAISHMTVNERDREPIMVINYDDAPNSGKMTIIRQVIARIDPDSLAAHNTWDCEIPESHINNIICQDDRIVLVGTTLYMGEPKNPIVAVYKLQDSIYDEEYDVCLGTDGEFTTAKINGEFLLLGGFRTTSARMDIPLVLEIEIEELEGHPRAFDDYENDLSHFPGRVLAFADHQRMEQGVLYAYAPYEFTSTMFWTKDAWQDNEYDNLEVFGPQYHFDEDTYKSICTALVSDVGDRMFLIGGYIPEGECDPIGMIREIEF